MENYPLSKQNPQEQWQYSVTTWWMKNPAHDSSICTMSHHSNSLAKKIMTHLRDPKCCSQLAEKYKNFWDSYISDAWLTLYIICCRHCACVHKRWCMGVDTGEITHQWQTLEPWDLCNTILQVSDHLHVDERPGGSSFALKPADERACVIKIINDLNVL